jgi:hypothetical protein
VERLGQTRKKRQNQRIKVQQYRAGEEIPEYLGRESAREKKVMARFRCGKEERENRYWMEGEERRC